MLEVLPSRMSMAYYLKMPKKEFGCGASYQSAQSFVRTLAPTGRTAVRSSDVGAQTAGCNYRSKSEASNVRPLVPIWLKGSTPAIR